jgi:hypothetical protein
MLRTAVKLAFDQAAFDAAINSGTGRQLIRDLESVGIVFDSSLGQVDFLKLVNGQLPRFRRVGKADGSISVACDAQPELVTTSNAGIPSYLTNYLDPRLIPVLVQPMKAAQILGETQKGNWLTNTVQFKIREFVGEVSSYGDFNNNGNVGVNLNFPSVQAYHYQTVSQWGQREAEEAGLAAVDWAQSINEGSILILNKFQNKSYFFGVAGLQLYGLLNHPDLSAPIAATSQWNLDATDAITVYNDIRRMFVQIQLQTGGLVDSDASMTLALSNVLQPALNKVTQYNVNVYKMLKDNFPNLRVINAPEYSTQSGELVQLIVDSVDGVPVATTAYTEKLRAHNMVVDMSSWKQKKSQGTLGTVVFFSPGIAQLTGA